VTCRAVELSISRSPGSAWTTDEETLSPAMSFVLPDRLTVVANNAGLHDVTLSYRLGEALHTCLYRARWKPVGQPDQFVSCTSGAVPGDAIEADWVALSSGGSPATITMTLEETLPCDGGVGGGTATGGTGQGGLSVGGFGGSGTGGVSHGGAGQGGSMAQGAGGLGGAGGVGGHGGVGQGGLGGDGGVAGTGGAGAAGGSGGAGGQGGEGGSGGGVSCADIVDDGDPCTIDRCDPSGALVRTTCSALDPTVSTTLYDALSFLFETEPLVQTGVAPGTIDVVAVAGITGRVVGPDGLGLSNVSVTILGHPEYGATLTDATGRYILAVNASHRLTLDLQAAGFIRAQRAVEAPMQHIAHAADVMLSVANASATFVDLEAITEPTPALGAVESDDAGPRQGALLFTPGTTAAMRFPDGSTQASSTLTVRITELTVGADGPRRMPGELPDNTAYTYAVDLQADEAVAGGAEHVSLSEPASYFLENFIGAPVGTAVPAGTYDYEQGLWVADPDGRVVQLVSISGGLADLDITGDGVVDSASAIEAIGISEDERAWLATRYAAGTELWHTEIAHFSVVDLNNMKGCPACEGPPDFPITTDDTCSAEEEVASVIECTNQTFGEDVPVAGTPYSLHYRSDRVPGRAAARRVTVPITDDTVSPVLRAIVVRLRVAGRQIEQRVECPCSPNQSTTIEWDGLDLFGRTTHGHQPAEIELAYEYPWGSRAPSPRVDGLTSFGTWLPDLELDVDNVRNIAEIRARRRLDLGRSGNEVHGLGRFSLDAVHTYDPASRTLYRGDGSRRRGDAVTSTLEPLHIKGLNDNLWDTLALPDGGFLMSLASGLYRRGPDGADTKIGPHVSEGCTSAFEIPALQSCYAKLLSNLTLGPDGSIYATIESGSRILRIRPNGIVSHVAGLGLGGETGDGGLATSAFVSCRSLAVGSDGAVYCGGNTTLRRIGPEGTIRIVAGGPGTVNGNDIPAAQAQLRVVVDMTFLRDGSLLLNTEGLTSQLRKIGTDGVIRCVAGCGGASYADGEPALPALLDRADDIAEGPDGTLTFTAAVAQLAPNGSTIFRKAIRTIGLDGRLGTLAGLGGPACPDYVNLCGVDGPALSANFSPSSLSIGADGKVFGHTPQMVFGLTADLPSFARSGFVVTEADGRTAYLFDAQGRHLQTFDADTGVVTLTVAHDDEGRLLSLTDRDGLVTTIARDAAGTPMEIVGPYSHRTALGLDDNGYLNRIEDPEGGAWIADYDDLGLMLSWTNRNGHQKTLTWDSGGLLQSVTDAALATTTLTAVSTAAGRAVTLESALGRTRTYGLAQAAGPSEVRANTGRNGLTTTSTRTGAATTSVTFPDGTVTSITRAPDPRFGMASPYVAEHVVTLLSGLTKTVNRTRAVTLAGPGALFELETRTEVTTLNGRSWSTTYDKSTSEVTTISPEGRVATRVLDALGRTIEVHAPGSLPVSIGYDLDGRPIITAQGTRFSVTSYGPDGMIASITDPLSRTTVFTRDAVGRVVAEERPDLAVTTLGYDLEGNNTAVVPPSKPAHGMTYNLVELLDSYTPPALATGGGATEYAYDLDRALTEVLQPGPRLVEHTYDAAGRPETTTFPGGVITRGYDTATGKLTTLAGPDVTLSSTYDGALLKAVAMTGPVAGTISWQHDTAFRVVEERVNGVHAATFAFDDDDLLTQAGGLTITRDPASGFVTQASAGLVTEAWSYNDYGEVETYTATVGGVVQVAWSYVRDDLGRIVEKTETTAAGSRVHVYEHDLAGRLIAVYEDGLLAESYGYDDNGNRLSSVNADGVFDASFDEQDRILEYGDEAFTWTDNGELLARTDAATGETTTFAYDAVGNLRGVGLPNGDLVEYLVDGRGRRVGKKVNGAMVKGWLWRGQLQPVAELDGAGNVVARFVYAGGVNVPALMVTPTATYRLVTDHLGSVRRVVDVATGAVVQELDYDAWGRVLLDTSPGLQPFGFAGGLYDPDTGLVRFGARDYEAETGRWTAKDPIRFGGGVNGFSYCDSDPINWHDPDGLVKLPADPSGLPPEWTPDETHRDPNGERYRHPSGDVLDFHKGRPGKPGWRGRDHWHHNGGAEHLSPGDEAPEPLPFCEVDMTYNFVLDYGWMDLVAGVHVSAAASALAVPVSFPRLWVVRQPRFPNCPLCPR
jgi:RHS repeat-associated protein